jgi:hypothetical protein
MGVLGLPLATLGYLWLPWVTFGHIGYLRLPALGYLTTYTGCPINIVPLPILGLIIATCLGTEAGEKHPVFCARTFQGLHSVRLWTPTIFEN